MTVGKLTLATVVPCPSISTGTSVRFSTSSTISTSLAANCCAQRYVHYMCNITCNSESTSVTQIKGVCARRSTLSRQSWHQYMCYSSRSHVTGEDVTWRYWGQHESLHSKEVVSTSLVRSSLLYLYEMCNFIVSCIIRRISTSLRYVSIMSYCWDKRAN